MKKVEQFIKERTRQCNNEIVGGGWVNGEYTPLYHEWLTPEQALRAAEIAREETIKEACQWLDRNACRYIITRSVNGYPMKQIKIGDYAIPEGCTVKRIGNTLKVYKKLSNVLADGDYRCKDCANRIEGYCFKSTQFSSWVCKLKPKYTGEDGITRYKSAYAYNKPCGNFIKK